MTRLEEALAKQRAIAESARGFQEAISRLLEAERIRLELERCAKMHGDNFKQYAGQENCCPYGEGK
jgi:hypothetical protein